jgi:hypothetical protein
MASYFVLSARRDVGRERAEPTANPQPAGRSRRNPKASVLKGGRVVFNIKANDYRLIALVQYVDSDPIFRIA